ncbi:hypothetical protein IBX65_04505 [Candidatus Aerophobetes bacterium]|nr:hypothetical protein [Candidatus Aerophobetes bacterium]
MRRYLFLALIPILLFTLQFAFAEEDEEPLTRLPTIVVRGEDRSYLEIIRPKEIYYMPHRGEKGKGEIPYELELPPHTRLETKLPTPYVRFIEIKPLATPVQIKEIPALSPIPPSLSQEYLGAERFTIPQDKIEKEFIAMEKITKKALIHPPLYPLSIIRETYLPPVGEPIPTEAIEMAKPPEITKVTVREMPVFTLADVYIQEEKIFLPEPERWEKVVIPEKISGEKKVIFFTPLIEVPEKSVAQIPPPRVSLEPPALHPLFYEKSIPREPIREISLRHLYTEATLRPGEKEKEPLLVKTVKEFREEKELIRPPVEAPHVERVYFPEKIKKSEYPFVTFAVGGDDAAGFNYQISYGREDADKRYLLTLKRDSSPHYVAHQSAPVTGETLLREIDVLQGGLSWGEVGENETQIYVDAAQKVLGLPGAGKRKDTSIYFSGKTTIADIWKVGVWGEKATREDNQPVEEKLDDLSYGANVSLQPKKSDFLIEGEINWDDLRKLSPGEDRRNRYQALLQVKALRPFSLSENIFLESPRIGIKGIQDREAELVGFVRVHWYGKDALEVLLDIDKDFYLPPFASTYIPQDYSQVALDMGEVSMTKYSLRLNYTRALLIDGALIIFSEHGNDLVWVYDDRRLNPKTVHLSREGVRLQGRWYITPFVIFEPSYTWKNVKNLQNSEEVIPHQPESALEALLTIYLFKREKDVLALEAKGEWLSERYYTFEPGDVLDASSRIGLKLTYQQERWKAFLGMESTNHFLSKDYKLLEKSLNFGLEIKLF